jgi:lysophospholipase L1-like esterase
MGQDEKTRDPFAGVAWHDALDLGIEGQGWTDVRSPYDRLPARAEGVVRDEVWERALQSAGLSVRFRTNATDIYTRWVFEWGMRLLHQNDTALQCAGLDCYGRDDDGRWYWVGAILPWRDPDPDGKFNNVPLDGREREYRVYLPLRSPVKSLHIGIPDGATLERCDPDPRKPIVYYGTSIVHGPRVSRPGMPHASQLQRRLDYPLINLGLAGNGKMEKEVADLLAELDPALYIVDCLPNVTPDMVTERLAVLVRTLRAAHPETPVLLVSDRLFGDATFCPQRAEMQARKSDAQKAVIDGLEADGVGGLHWIPPQNFFGDDFEGTVDGSHPTDVGAMRMADTLEPVVRKLLSL